MCTVTYADIMAVLCALPAVIKQGLSAGEIVRLGDLGSLQMGLRSKGAKTEKEFTLANITKARFLTSSLFCAITWRILKIS